MSRSTLSGCALRCKGGSEDASCGCFGPTDCDFGHPLTYGYYGRKASWRAWITGVAIVLVPVLIMSTGIAIVLYAVSP